MSFGTSENSFLSSFRAALQPLEKNVVVNNLGVKQQTSSMKGTKPTSKARKLNPKGLQKFTSTISKKESVKLRCAATVTTPSERQSKSLSALWKLQHGRIVFANL